MRKEYKYPAIYVNPDKSDYPFPLMITIGMKTIETRSKATLDRFIGKRVGILTKKKGERFLIGFIDIVGKKVYNSKQEFDQDLDKHWVFDCSEYYIKDKKVGYILENPVCVLPIKIVGKAVPGDYQALDLEENYEN